MPVSFKVVDNRTNFSKKIAELSQQLDDYGTYFLQGMADQIVLTSPVDTGTYMESHRLGKGVAGGYTSSFGKPKNQDYNSFAQDALNKLYADIEALGDNWDSARFTNIALHAQDVEYTHGHAVYTMARDLAPEISRRAAQRAKGS